MLPKSNVSNGISDDTAAENKNGDVVFVYSDYKPAPYPDDVVNYRHVVIHEELPENTWCGSELQVYVRKVTSPSDFWINLCGIDYSRKLVTLCADMRQFYEDEHERYLLPTYAVRVGQFCVCIYKNEWHRVRIVNVPDKDLVDVFLIDCGNTVTVNSDNLRFMHKKYADLPMQCFRADLPDIKPRNSAEWPTSVCEYFRQETSGKKFRAKVLNIFRERHWLSLKLVDVNGNSVSEKLLSNKMAEVETEDIECPEAPPDSILGSSFVKVETIIGIPEDPSSHSSDDSLSEVEEAAGAPVSWRNIDHKDVTINGRRLLLVTIKDKYYFVLSDFLQAFVVMHEHVVLKLLETFPSPVVVEKLEYKELRVLLQNLIGRRIRGMTHLADRGIMPSVYLLPVNVACELLAFLGEDGRKKVFLHNFVSSLL